MRERRTTILRRLRRRFAEIPADMSLVDELIAERRAEAEREWRATNSEAGAEGAALPFHSRGKPSGPSEADGT